MGGGTFSVARCQPIRMIQVVGSEVGGVRQSSLKRPFRERRNSNRRGSETPENIYMSKWKTDKGKKVQCMIHILISP